MLSIDSRPAYRRAVFAAAALAGALPAAGTALAQDHSDHHAMHGPDEPPAEDMAAHHGHHTDHGDGEPCMAAGLLPVYAEGSGTARLPGHEGTPGTCGMAPSGHSGGIHLAHGDGWMAMAHGFVAAQYTDHGGPRGDDKAYVTSMLMLMGERETGWGRLQLKSMMSLEPAMDARGYPNLFATGETAGGEPLVDRQHPHDLFMELAARVDVNLAPGTSAFLYGGPVAEPALGPSAFMHRGSAALNPEPPITHHWFDSTHITYGVVTAGLAARHWQAEASAFRGAEPDEDRWDIEKPKIDSWSARLSFTPSPEWAVQASYGEMQEPEALHPGEDEHRTTVSVHYAGGQGLSAMAAFSAKKRVEDHDEVGEMAEEEHGGGTLTAWLAEANYDFAERHTVFARIENVRNDELFPDHDDPLHEVAFRVSKFQAGYAHRLPLGAFTLALGGSAAVYAKPAALDAAYGKSPFGYTLFARLMLGH